MSNAVCHPERPLYLNDECRSCFTGKRNADPLAVSVAVHDRLTQFSNGRPKDDSPHNIYKRLAQKAGAYREEKFLEQSGRCAICGVPQAQKDTELRLDHDHKTGYLRGLLCHGCNMALGAFQDDVRILQAAIDYILEYRKRHESI